jgi:hypothetical protein
MKTINEVLEMSQLQLIQDHARLDTKLEITQHEITALRHGLRELVEELKNARRYDDAMRVLEILQVVHKDVTAFIDQLNPAA